MSDWIPSWACYAAYCVETRSAKIYFYEFCEDALHEASLNGPEWKYVTIEELKRDLAIADACQQIKDKPLHSRMDVIGQNGNTGEHYDNVTNPKHYQLLPGVEVYDVRSAILNKLKGRDDVTPGMVDDWSRAWEYITRMWEKNGKEDAKKALWYLSKLIGKMDE